MTVVASSPDGSPHTPAVEHRVGGVPLATLVRDYHRPMVNFARTLLNSPALAEEAVQEAWVQVLQAPCAFEGRSSVATWLFGIVRNTAHRHRRRESRIREHELLSAHEDGGIDDADPLAGRMHTGDHPDAGHWSAPPSDRFLPEDRSVAPELVGQVRAALDALPARQRRLVILRDIVGTSAEEAAEILELSAQAQRALLYRARGNLRNEMERRCRR